MDAIHVFLQQTRSLVNYDYLLLIEAYDYLLLVEAGIGSEINVGRSLSSKTPLELTGCESPFTTS